MTNNGILKGKNFVLAAKNEKRKTQMASGFIQLTTKMKARIVDENTVVVETKQKVGGGGSRNIITWALLASKQGFDNIILRSMKWTDADAEYGIKKAVERANELLSHKGVTVTYNP